MASVLETRLEELRKEQEQLLQGGGAKAIERQHGKARLTARERIARLRDEGSPWHEIGLFAAWGMYEEWGGAVAAGVVCGLGKIHGRWTMIIANDATVKAGAFFPMTAKKVLRCQTIALENHLPLVYLVDSAGVFLPLQDEVFPDIDDFGRVFRHNAVASAMGIPQITAIMGNCVAGGAYLPVMCDTILMTEGSGLYLAGPALVQAAIGQKVSSEELGGAHLHAAISGTVDFREANDEDCCRRIRSLMSRLGPPPLAPFDRIATREPQRPAADLLEVFPGDPQASYDVRDVLACILDAGEFDEYRAEFGQTLVCGYGRLGGFAVGVVANQKKMVKRTTATGSKRIEFGGVIYPESADKAARFIMDCNQGRIPLLFLHDVNGFMVGKEMEAAGIIRAGAKMVNVVANSVVPKFSVVIGGSFGAGNYAMCGRAYDPRLLLAWPMARYAVMGGEQAANTLLDLRVRQLERGGRKLAAEEREELLASIRASYEAQTDPRYGAARLWTDAIIEPQETRAWLIAGLEAASLNPDLAPFRTGVLQT
ncbi:MAG: acyl-CoA carboxylase subunit beta [Acidobacteria bacterium]|nr:MAG: acyl-CoA carboxylase subunit beta [Acidobacteriota bacterium]